MIISSLEELRLFSPSNAIDNIDSLAGFIGSSEHDFLKEKLGSDLYHTLVYFYNSEIANDIDEYICRVRNGKNLCAFYRLLFLSQKAVTFDALARAVSVQAISVNGAGVNVASSDDYKAADPQTIAEYKKACVRESHSAINELLQTLEEWAIAMKDCNHPKTMTGEGEIVALWTKSRYYYLCSSLLIPSASVLQDYYNIYDSREKFIQLLPDLHYIQEDIVAPIYGEQFVEYLADFPFSTNSDSDKHTLRIIHIMRKIIARYLESRLIKESDPRHETSRNEAIKLTNRLDDYLRVNQQSFCKELSEAFASSPLYVVHCEKSEPIKKFSNNSANNCIFITPGIM